MYTEKSFAEESGMQVMSIFSTRSLSRQTAGAACVSGIVPSVISLYTRHTASALSMLLLAAGLLFASCANAVNSRGGPVDAGGGSSGSSGSSSGGNTTRNVRGGN